MRSTPFFFLNERDWVCDSCIIFKGLYFILFSFVGFVYGPVIVKISFSSSISFVTQSDSSFLFRRYHFLTRSLWTYVRSRGNASYSNTFSNNLYIEVVYGATVANAAVAYFTINSLRLSPLFVSSRNINKNEEFMGITILLDELVRIVSILFMFFSFLFPISFLHKLKLRNI